MVTLSYKELDVQNLLMKNQIKCLDLINCLIHLKMLLKNTDKISIVKDIEINNMIKELKAEKIDELALLEENLRLRSLRNRFLRRSNSIEEEMELRKHTAKKIDSTERLKTEVEEWEFKSVKLLQDLNYKNCTEIAEIKRIEMKLQALKHQKQ